MKTIPYEDFGYSSYKLMPFRFDRLDNDRVLIINEVGQSQYINSSDLDSLINGNLNINSNLFQKLLSKSFIYTDDSNYQFRTLASKFKTRKSFLIGGPALHIFVLTLRCDNSCEYCQVTRRNPNDYSYDMKIEDARQSVYRMFESPSKNITVEFQGGEPLLAFDILKYIVELTLSVNNDKKIQFVVATSLQYINYDILIFLKKYDIHISTSLDGPQWLHNKNRPNSCKDSYTKTLHGLYLARKWLGVDNIAGMTTITRDSLKYPKQIIDEYISHGFHSIFLRPLNMYGFAVKKEKNVSYTMDEFNEFYIQALDYIIKINQNGYLLEEVSASLALNNALTPFASGYVDMRSPCGDGTGVLVYNYNGKIYPSDESRMLFEMGDNSLCLGDASDSYLSLMSSPVMKNILNSGIAEALPGCCDCAYLPYCGANPVQNYSRYHDMVGHRANNSFCTRQKFLYRYLFKLMEDDNNKEIFFNWLTKSSPQQGELYE
ncbi:His-Xaa-Ser system radical SAM maturase HxsB [Vibrio tritonius]|uniref:His-Xaa-Ser system radical SAM maturase HxsB n=1 Tax=Vibrio tritonius TaxID=1435069 RepID=A0ABS7YKW0_9VIBR|nr:His-Xaa-Ser system radical SAM maturase HxsB [Vibrio tritonius]MCA2015516.1 His-Xaa-Ser system radical SAM maturase HxsB [Vibrio tritonius]